MNHTLPSKPRTALLHPVLVSSGYSIFSMVVSLLWTNVQLRAGVTSWHPSTGFSFGMLLYFGPAWAPVIFVLQLFAWVFIYHLPLNMGSISIHLFSTLAYTVAAAILRWLIPGKGRVVHLREASIFLFAAVLTSMAVAYVTARLMVTGQIISPMFYLDALTHLGIRQALSTVVGAPAIYLVMLYIHGDLVDTFLQKKTNQPGVGWRGKIKSILTNKDVVFLNICVTLAVGWMIFLLRATNDWRPWFLLFLPLVLVIYHYGIRGAIISGFVIYIGAVAAAYIFQYSASDYNNLILFVMVLCMSGFIMGAAFSEGRDAERTLRYRLGIEETISSISSRFINLQSSMVDDEIRRAMGDLCVFCGVDASHLFLFGRDFTITKVYEWVKPGQRTRVEVLEGHSMKILPWMLKELGAGNVVHMPTLHDLPEMADAEKQHFLRNELRSLVTVPLRVNGILIGSLGFHNEFKEKLWTDEDIRMLTLAGQIFLNVIERSRAEARMRESDLKFRSIVLQSYDGVLLIDENGQVTEWNRSMERITGWRRTDALGKYIWDVQNALHNPTSRSAFPLEQARETTMKLLSGSSSSGFNRVRESEIIRPDGTVRLIQSLMFPIRSSYGVMIGSFTRDMTDVRLGAEELRRSQTNLAEAERLARLGHFRFCVDDGSMEWSEEAYRISCYDPKDTPPPIHQILPMIPLEDQAEILESIRVILEDKHPVSLEYRIRIPDGPEKVLLSVMRPEFHGTGKVTHIFGTIMDITERKYAEEALRESELRFKELADSVSDYFFGLDWDMRITYWNPASEELTHTSAADVVGKDLYEVFPQLRGSTAEQFALEAFRTRQHQGFVMEWPTRERMHYLEVNAYPGKHGLSVFMRDVTERQQAQERLRQSESRYRAVVEDQTDLISRFRQDGTMTFVNEAYCRVLGVLRSEVIGRRFYTFNISFGNGELSGEKTMLYGNANPIIYESQALFSDGKVHWVQWLDRPILDDQNNVVEYQSVGRDISESKRLEEELRYLSTHDMLTGIYNRAFFETELKRMQRSRLYPISVLMVDVNGLKDTNDTLGHAVGDDLLRATAQVLGNSFRPEDIVSRFGGDEFAVLLPGLDERAAEEVLQRVRLNQQYYNQSQTGLILSLSLGIATAVKGDPLVDVLSQADRRMYMDKSRQKGTRELSDAGL